MTSFATESIKTSCTSSKPAAGAVVPVERVVYFPSRLWKGAKRLPFISCGRFHSAIWKFVNYVMIRKPVNDVVILIN